VGGILKPAASFMTTTSKVCGSCWRNIPALLFWKRMKTTVGLLGMATGSYGEASTQLAEQHFTRAACAELLLDAGAFVAPSICDGSSPRALGSDRSLHREVFSPERSILCRPRRRPRAFAHVSIRMRTILPR